MIKLYLPQYKDLWFRQMFLSDEETMSYNHAWGGTIDFPEERWADWYDYWICNTNQQRFYRYLIDEDDNLIGEVAYHYDEAYDKYIADIIIYAKYRGKGYGYLGLKLLCDSAKENGLKVLYDDIAIDNPAIYMFLKHGFIEEYRDQDIIMLKKQL